MSVKRFSFLVCLLTTPVVRAEFAREAASLGAAFAAGVGELPAAFADKRAGLRLFQFDFANGRTGEKSGFIGQGEDVAGAWADGVKNTFETFRPKNDGKSREQNGVTILLAPRPGDTFAVGRAVSRSIASFESDETYEQERIRKRLEAERARLAAERRVA